MSDYTSFVKSKLTTVPATGITGALSLPASLFPHQSALTSWALRRGRAAIFADINASDTLQYTSAREHDDERHICPLQLQVIERGVMLWTHPGDIVLSPFMGIGSEGYVSVKMGRKFVGAELKTSYFGQAAKNIAGAVAFRDQDLFTAEAA
jgi:DNA modification methylase